MQINQQTITFIENITYTHQTYELQHKAYPMHYHSECELTYVEEHTGRLYTNNKVIDFKKGDLFFIAPNQIHRFKNRLVEGKCAGLVSIYFGRDFLGSDFLNRQEVGKLNELFRKAEYGVLHFSPGRDLLGLMERLGKARPLSGIVVLLEILNRLSLDRAVRHYPNEVLLSKHYLRCSTDDRMERIHVYLMRHYREKVLCSEVAAMVGMCTASFSRFFRHRTRKTFTQVLTEIRMMKAQKLLLESDKQVCEIARECGFRNLSHFNRVFKQWNGMRPGSFREV